jgi:hypothetical protein
MSYHTRKIEKGKLGEFSKIKEEFEELEDAINQGNKVLAICELCDLVGAIKHYGEKIGISLDDMVKMMYATERAFLSGSRK